MSHPGSYQPQMGAPVQMPLQMAPPTAAGQPNGHPPSSQFQSPSQQSFHPQSSPPAAAYPNSHFQSSPAASNPQRFVPPPMSAPPAMPGAPQAPFASPQGNSSIQAPSFQPPPSASFPGAPAAGAAPGTFNPHVRPPTFAPPPSGFPSMPPPSSAAPVSVSGAGPVTGPAPGGFQPPNGLPNRFPAPPAVSVPPPNVAAMNQQREQVVFNQVQPHRPFEDGSGLQSPLKAPPNHFANQMRQPPTAIPQPNFQSPHQQPPPVAQPPMQSPMQQQHPAQPPMPSPMSHLPPSQSQHPAMHPAHLQQFNQQMQSPNGMAIPPSTAGPVQPQAIPPSQYAPPQQHMNGPNAYNDSYQQQQQQQQQHQQQQGQYQQSYQQQSQGHPQQQQQQQPPPQQYDQYGQPIQQQPQAWSQTQHSPQNGYPPVQSPQGSKAYGQQQMMRRPNERIDPKQIPRRVDATATGPTMRYHTRSMTLPPPATADFVCVDEGNCSPRFIRLTTNNIAHESELIDQTKLCIGAIIQPLANLGDGEEAVPVVYYPKGPLRCGKCMAYVNPFFQFIDSGNSFICNLCSMKNDVPEDYRCNLDANGFRRDRHERAELCRGTVEFEVGAEFIARPISDPVYLFVIDVSYGAVVSGLVGAAITAVRSAIDQMGSMTQADGTPNRTKVGVITYDQSVHYYSLKPPRTEPVMFVMSDVDDPFVPCPPGEICVHVGVEENRALLHSTLDMLASVYERTKVAENMPVFGAAITAAADTLTLLGGGKILIMQSNLPQNGIGKLDHRDNINLYLTDKEKTLQVPQNAFYSTLATKCAEAAITVDLFVCSNGYVDLATVGALTEKTGGQTFLYPGFNARKDGLALQRDLFHDVTRLTGFDGIMIVRCSTGLKVAEHFGNFYHRKVQEMELASIDCDKTFGVRFEHEGKLKDKTEACFQCALLYTTASGHRRIRVHTISVPVTSVMSNIFRFADLDAIVNLSLKQAVRQLLDTTSCLEAQNALTMACIDSLFVYRKFCASATSAGQLILPEPLKLLPLCTLGLVKHPLFQDGLAADERSFLFNFVNSMPCYVSVAFVCPRLFNLTNFEASTCVPDETGRVALPMPLTLSSESVSTNGLYLLDDGRYMYLYIGSDLPMQFLEDVFLIKGDGKTQAGQYRVRHVSNAPYHISSRINVLIGTLRKNKPNFQNLQVISRRLPGQTPGGAGPSPSPTNRAGWETFESLDENLFFSHLIEDAVHKPELQKTGDPRKDKLAANARPPNTMSYIDFLCFIHKRIQAKFL